MIFQASAGSLRSSSVSDFFLHCGQSLKNERGVLIGGKLFGGSLKITL